MKPAPRRLRNGLDPRNSAGVSALIANALQSAVTLAAQLIDLAIQVPNRVHRLVDRGPELGCLALPPADTVHLGGPAPLLGVDLVAELALGACLQRLHDEFHAARLANPVLLGTVLAEMSPFPIAARKTMLIEEAHVSRVQEQDCLAFGSMLAP
jgi:hypothetical protein